MYFIKKLIEKIRSIFRWNFLSKQGLLPEGCNQENIKHINNVTIKNDIQKIENSTDMANEITQNEKYKSDFFRMYQAFKDGKIKKENLLITDLIDIELMMMTEKELLKEQISYEEEEIKLQEIKLKELIRKNNNLEGVGG